MERELADLMETCARVTSLCVAALGGVGTKSHDDLTLALKELATATCIVEDLVVNAAGGVRDEESLAGLYAVCRQFASQIQNDGIVKIQTAPVGADEIQ